MYQVGFDKFFRMQYVYLNMQELYEFLFWIFRWEFIFEYVFKGVQFDKYGEEQGIKIVGNCMFVDSIQKVNIWIIVYENVC